MAGGQGGARPGAGRKPGSAAGQVQKIRTVARQKIVDLMQKGRDPLDAVLDIAFDMDLPVAVRLQAAISALPFVHPRLSSQTIDSRSIQAKVDSAEVLATLQSRLDRLAAPAPLIEVTAEPVEAGQ